MSDDNLTFQPVSSQGKFYSPSRIRDCFEMAYDDFRSKYLGLGQKALVGDDFEQAKEERVYGIGGLVIVKKK